MKTPDFIKDLMGEKEKTPAEKCLDTLAKLKLQLEKKEKNERKG